MTERLTVWQFFPDGTHECVGRDLDDKAAVEMAHSYTTRPAARIGIIREVRIVDADDFTVFQWINGKGVTYPTPEMRGAR